MTYDIPRRRVLVWHLVAGGFAGEDFHRLSYRRLRPLLVARLGDDAPAIEHAAGGVEEAVARGTAADRPDVLVLPSFRNQMAGSLAVVARLAAAAPELPVVLSGWGTDPEYVALLVGEAPRHPRFSMARGEAEEALVDALVRLAGPARDGGYPEDGLVADGLAVPDGVGGWRAEGRFRTVADPATLPSAYLTGELTPDEFEGMVLVEVARGCLFRCRFCLTCGDPRRGLRRFPTARIVDEIRYASERGAKAVGLLCSGLNYDREVLHAVADAFEALPPERRPRMESTVHTSLLDPERYRDVARLPWERMIIGLQSTNPAALAVMGRKVDPPAFRKAIFAIARFHTPVVELILGLPGDSLLGFLGSVRFVLDLPADIEIYHLRLDPGSEFLRNRAALGLTIDARDQAKVLATPTFSAEELRQAIDTLREIGRSPWRHRARRLGFDFETLYDGLHPGRRSAPV